MVGERMKIYHIGIDHGDEIKTPITACIGYFDGLHLGHQKLVECVVETAKNTNTEPSLHSFPYTTLFRLGRHSRGPSHERNG